MLMSEMVRFLHSGPLAPIKRWGTKWSLWPVHLVTACCGVELAHAYASGYDGERLGSLNYGISRQTNLIIVEGAITRKMARILKMTYEQMPDPKFVMVMGACGLRGGLFWNGYHMVKPSDVVPVDFFIPGCPPTPEAMLRGIRELQEKIWRGEARNSISFNKVDMLRIGSPRLAPPSPKKIAKTPLVKVNVDRAEKWKEGGIIVKEVSDLLGELALSVTITGRNRICVFVKPENAVEAAKRLSRLFDHVKSVNVIDVPHENSFIVEYVLSSYSNKKYMPILLTMASRIDREDARFPSLIEVYPSADYLEREMHDLFGVWFEGNPGMGMRFLIAPDTPENPLRKDFRLEEEVYTGGGGR